MKKLVETFTAVDAKGNRYEIKKETPVDTTNYIDGHTDTYLKRPKFTYKGNPINLVRENVFYIIDLDTEVTKVT
jgi:hypothetical protein